ncbi:hypothetical protein HNR23_005019 [Nocardiopsis mwathae]|uniref:Uncharacterized protein n=1 Tax=Nocardiopsis mwathae TaxID=1472723 RepID=A0A7W9YMY7_9ACTN|nr:hypothetical protein [Nocardiopsis mwathae]MBB6174959.1 hypothetical protein [Nocardiopsis mwathae]
MRIRLTDRQRIELAHAATTPGGLFRHDVPTNTIVALIGLGFAMPKAFGQPHRITRAGRAANAGDETGALTWQRLTSVQRSVLCALFDGRNADRAGSVLSVNAATFKRLAAAGFIENQGRNDGAHSRLTGKGRDAVLRIRGERPAFTEQEITEVRADELCVGDSFIAHGRRWIVASPPTSSGYRIDDKTVPARAENDPKGRVRELTLPAGQVLQR